MLDTCPYKTTFKVQVVSLLVEFSSAVKVFCMDDD